MADKNNTNMGNGEGFEREMLTHIKYMREKQESHDKLLGKVFNKIDGIKEEIDAKFLGFNNSFNEKITDIETDIASAKGIGKGAMLVGGIGSLVAILIATAKSIWEFIIRS